MTTPRTRKHSNTAVLSPTATAPITRSRASSSLQVEHPQTTTTRAPWGAARPSTAKPTRLSTKPPPSPAVPAKPVWGGGGGGGATPAKQQTARQSNATPAAVAPSKARRPLPTVHVSAPPRAVPGPEAVHSSLNGGGLGNISATDDFDKYDPSREPIKVSLCPAVSSVLT